MELNSLTAVSPIDGRYSSQLIDLQQYFSEFALFKYRLKVELRYLAQLYRIKLFKANNQFLKLLLQIENEFNLTDCLRIKEIEKTTKHDIKALEYFIKEKLSEKGYAEIGEWVHFALTSQDINNTAFPCLWKDSIEMVYLPSVFNLVALLTKQAKAWKKQPMLSRTHGQAASPTTVGKEWEVYLERIEQQVNLLVQIPYSGKFGGATGNFNAHKVAFPNLNWERFADNFLETELNLQRQQKTTQIEHYDNLAAQFDALKRINTILIDLCRDIWTYISLNYFGQTITKGQVGSSTMPHKVNPIDFENAEGNFGIANALFEHLSAKLPISRLQRDLTDSTVLRNIGIPFAHTILAVQSMEKGLNKLVLNKQVLQEDLNKNWAVVAEAIQTILRRENYPKPYEALKSLTQGKSSINKADIQKFIQSLKVSKKIKDELKKISPENYIGYA